MLTHVHANAQGTRSRTVGPGFLGNMEDDLCGEVNSTFGQDVNRLNFYHQESECLVWLVLAGMAGMAGVAGVAGVTGVTRIV